MTQENPLSHSKWLIVVRGKRLDRLDQVFINESFIYSAFLSICIAGNDRGSNSLQTVARLRKSKRDQLRHRVPRDRFPVLKRVPNTLFSNANAYFF